MKLKKKTFMRIMTVAIVILMTLSLVAVSIMPFLNAIGQR